MSDPDDYEALPATASLGVTCFAGALAGIAEHCVMFPIDSVKTRMQSLACDKNSHQSISTVLRTMVREEGVFRPIRGMNAMAAGAGPAHALYFPALEYTRRFFHEKHGVPIHVSSALSAVTATLLHDAVMTPADVVKQRMQMCCSPYSSCTQAAYSIFRAEGARAFYRSYGTQLTMNIPFQAAVVTTYSVCQKTFNPEGRHNPNVHFLAGAVAGGVACAVTMPLDVCKTLLNTQEAGVLSKIKKTKVVGLRESAAVVYRIGGISGFFQGLSARVLYQAPSTAVSWTVYEFFKYYLNKNGGKRDEDDYDTIKELRAVAATSSVTGPRVSAASTPN